MKLDELRKKFSVRREDNNDLDELLEVDKLEAEVEVDKLEAEVEFDGLKELTGDRGELALKGVRVSFDPDRLEAEGGFNYKLVSDAYRKFLRNPPTGVVGSMLMKLKSLRGHASNASIFFPDPFTFRMEDLQEFVASMEAAGFIVWLPGSWVFTSPSTDLEVLKEGL